MNKQRIKELDERFIDACYAFYKLGLYKHKCDLFPYIARYDMLKEISLNSGRAHLVEDLVIKLEKKLEEVKELLK